MTYRTSICDAIETIGRARRELHKNPDLEHEPVLTYVAYGGSHKDEYNGCTCTKELDLVLEVLMDMQEILPFISDCLKAGVPVDLSSLTGHEAAGSAPLIKANKIEYIKLVRSITDLGFDDARNLAKRVAESEGTDGKL